MGTTRAGAGPGRAFAGGGGGVAGVRVGWFRLEFRDRDALVFALPLPVAFSGPLTIGALGLVLPVFRLLALACMSKGRNSSPLETTTSMPCLSSSSRRIRFPSGLV